MNIQEFKQGDFITRVEPIEKDSFTPMSWSMTQTNKDYTFIGEKLEFKGVINGLIHCIFYNSNEGIEPRHVTFVACRDMDGWEMYQEFDIDNI